MYLNYPCASNIKSENENIKVELSNVYQLKLKSYSELRYRLILVTLLGI
jgi:hypothetical protein